MVRDDPVRGVAIPLCGILFPQQAGVGGTAHVALNGSEQRLKNVRVVIAVEAL